MDVGEPAEDRADVVAGDVDDRLAPGLGAQDGWDLHLRHRRQPRPLTRSGDVQIKEEVGAAAFGRKPADDAELATPGPSALAEQLVVRELAEVPIGDLGSVRAADRAVGVAPNLELGELGAERLEQQ